MQRQFVRIAGVAVALVVWSVASVAAGTYTCSTVARRGLTDPVGNVFVNRFTEPDINLTSDVVFLSRTAGGPKAVYLYPGAGAASVVAAEDQPAPGGGVFRRFETPSVNNGQDIAFFGDLVVGEGVYVLESGGALAKAAKTSDPAPAPGGGNFDTFEYVSRVNAAGDVAFLANVLGGPSGIFKFTVATTIVSPVAVVGDVTLGGRELCSFANVDLSDTGFAVFQAISKLSCANVVETAVAGIFQETGLGIRHVALAGDATPIGGTTYNRFFDVHPTLADKVGFRAKTVGTVAVTAIFLNTAVGPTTTKLVAVGDPAPESGGAIKTIPQMQITDDDRAYFRGRVSGGSTKAGLFLFDTTDEAAVLESDAVPADLYGAGSTYRKIYEDADVDRSSTRVTYAAKVRDTVSPASKTGVFRCTGP